MPSLLPVLDAYARLYPNTANWNIPFRRLAAVRDIRNGTDAKTAAKNWNVGVKSLQKYLLGDPVETMFGVSWAGADGSASEDVQKKHRLAKRGIGQMMLGIVAERAFEIIYKREMGTADLALEDKRGDRNDTDYRVVNGSQRPVFRINIKSHGTPFRKAKEMVGLEPEDCFALGTYKIYQGLNKEKEERLPYIFMVATAPNLTGESIGSSAPDDILRLATLLKVSKGVADLRKRDMEEYIVDLLVGPNAPQSFVAVREDVLKRLEAADWRVLSAKRANQLLLDKLWERVYAVKVRGFAQNYPNAELDMHFQLSKDMTPLHEFLHAYKERGLHYVMSLLSRGDF